MFYTSLIHTNSAISAETPLTLVTPGTHASIGKDTTGSLRSKNDGAFDLSEMRYRVSIGNLGNGGGSSKADLRCRRNS